MKKLSVRVSRLNVLSVFLIGSILAYLVLGLAAGRSEKRLIPVAGVFDYRITGASTRGWTRPDFTFEEPSIYHFGASIFMAFDATRPPEAGDAVFDFRAGDGIHPDVRIGRDPLVMPSPSNRWTPIQIQGIAKNPFIPEGGSEKLGTRLVRIELRPNNLILFPTLQHVGLLVAFVSIFSLVAGRLLCVSSARISLIPLGLSLVALYLLHQDSLYYHWSRAWWLWAALSVLAVGILITWRAPKVALNRERASGSLTIAILITTLFALWLRISAVGFGLPQLYHPDESRKLRIAQKMIETGNLDPDYFRHPSFMLYSTAGLGKIKQQFTGVVPTIPELAVLGRSVSAVLGGLTIPILAAIGAILFSPTAGAVAGALLAVAPLHVVCSRYIKEDVCMIFFSLLSLLLIVRFCFKTPRVRYLLVAGFCAGLASSVKYTGILSGSFLAVPLLLRGLSVFLSMFGAGQSRLVNEVNALPFRSVSTKKLLLSFAAGCALLALAFVAVTPFSILNSETFIADFIYEKEHMDRGHAGAISPHAYFWTYHLRFSVLPAITTATTVFALGSVGIVLGAYGLPGLAVFLGVLLFYLPAEFVNAKPFPQPERYILPCVPFLCLAAGASVTLIASRLVGASRARFATVAISLALILPPLLYSVGHRNAALYDTRQRATDWVMKNIPQGSTIVTDWYFYAPSFSSGNYNVLELKNGKQDKLMRNLSLAGVQETGARYFIVSSFFYQRFLRQLKRGNRTGIGFDEIFTKLEPEVVFNADPYSYGFHNPRIRIYKIPPASNDAKS